MLQHTSKRVEDHQKRLKLVLWLVLVASGIGSIKAHADAVSDWSAVATTAAVVNAKRSPGPATFDLAYVHVAIYDSVNAIDGRYTPFAVRLDNAPAGASQEAAIAAAAYTILTVLYPTQQAFLDPVYTAALAAIPMGRPRARGLMSEKPWPLSFLLCEPMMEGMLMSPTPLAVDQVCTS